MPAPDDFAREQSLAEPDRLRHRLALAERRRDAAIADVAALRAALAAVARCGSPEEAAVAGLAGVAVADDDGEAA